MNIDQKVRSLTEKVLREESPAELALLPLYDPATAGSSRVSEGPLGIGVESAAVLLLPVLFAFFDKILEELAKDAAKELVVDLKAYISKKLPGLRASLIGAGLSEKKSDEVANMTESILLENQTTVLNK
jgi:hypothetical protein